MSQIGKEFFREWVGTNLDGEASATANVAALLAEAEEQGIDEREIAQAVGGNLLAAMRKAMAATAKE